MLSVLCTVYNEADFLDYSLRSYKDFVDNIVIVEGAYQETIGLGKSTRSTDGTIDIIKKYADNQKIFHIEANEKSDAQQRNVGLKKIQELKNSANETCWVLVIDGDEIWDQNNLNMVKMLCRNMEKANKLAAYFQSITFVNDFNHNTVQTFPRLFKVTKDCEFVSDNYMKWGSIDWFSPYVLKIPYIQFYHFAFCKGLDRFDTKKKWWETRFGKPFDYGWHVSDGKITDDNHQIVPFTGKLPPIMDDHPLYGK